jgi:heme/copper-type cytochrome/quinol oxidase subunit 2
MPGSVACDGQVTDHRDIGSRFGDRGSRLFDFCCLLMMMMMIVMMVMMVMMMMIVMMIDSDDDD